VLPSGLIFTVAGNGKSGDSGDGGPATQANMSNGGIANGVSGTLYVPEPATNHIRKLTPVSPAATVVSAASSLVGLQAPGSIATAYGPDLANATLPATTVPLPLTLSGTTVSILDSSGATTQAPLFFVSPGQVNFFIPPSVADGTAIASFISGDGTVSVASLTIAAVSPGLFLLNSASLAAANVITVDTDGTQVYGNDFEVTNGAIAALPINLGPPATTVYLVLYGTGISGRDSLANVSVTIGGLILPVAYAGPQGETGLDQVNVQIPASLAGSGAVNVTITVDSLVSNTATVSIM